MSSQTRLLKALSRDGLDVRVLPDGYEVRLPGQQAARVLLPLGFPLESKAVQQIARLAAARHPGGGGVVKCCASPDFHPGDGGVAIGSSAHVRDAVIPAAIGGDIACGMRLHVDDLTEDQFEARLPDLVRLLRGDFFYGTRDVAQTAEVQDAMFRDGPAGWWYAQQREGWRRGQVARSDHAQLTEEISRLAATPTGDPGEAPEDLVPDAGVVRDDGLGTSGGGNHFVEFQVVDEIMDRHAAYELGLRVGQVAYMVRTGSRLVGKYIGGNAQDRARAAWELLGLPYPDGDLFPVCGPDMARYLAAEATATNYGVLNRLLVAEQTRLRLREVYGATREFRMVQDINHNVTLPHPGGGYVHRKGACPADPGRVLLVPGSMGSASYVATGLGAEDYLSSASHGAGRARARVDMKREDDLGLAGVRCEVLRPERLVEEAPAAYKDIGPIMDLQGRAGVLRVVARLRPLITFKG